LFLLCELCIQVELDNERDFNKPLTSELINIFIPFYQGLYYDGKIDKQTVQQGEGSTTYAAEKSHYLIVSQPDGGYLGFCIPENGTGWFY
jgi:hypothetical protein